MGQSKDRSSNTPPPDLPFETTDSATLEELVHMLTTPTREAEAVPALTPKQLAALSALIGSDVLAKAIRRAQDRLARGMKP